MKDMAIDRMNELQAPEMMDDREMGRLYGRIEGMIGFEYFPMIRPLWSEHVALREYARRVSQMGII